MNQVTCGCNRPVLIPAYPFQRGALYQCDCCTQMHQPNQKAQYPISGQMQENAFMLINSVPYLLDNFTTNYGTKLSVSENVYTKVSRSTDPSCINLTAAIDMTGDIVTNTVWKAFIEDVISSQYELLNHVLPIQKSSVTFRIHFSLLDNNGGLAYQSYVDSMCTNHLFHYTDIQDFFITSFKNVAVTNIPQLDYAGLYNLRIDRVEAYATVIDTKLHVTDMNPYYQWTANNTRIVLQHDTIERTGSDSQVMIGSTDVNYTIAVQLNVTTRLRIAFTVYMSNTIKSNDSYGIYKALYNPTEHIIETLAQRVTVLESEVAALTTALNAMYMTCIEYKKNTLLRKGVLVWLTPGEVYQASTTYTTTSAPITTDEAFAADVLDGKLVPINDTNG